MELMSAPPKSVGAQYVSFMIYGPSKVGKSWLADTAPAPRLHLDAEGGNGTKYLTSKKIYWDPTVEVAPEWDGSWETCIVDVRSYKTVEAVYQRLNSHPHPFRTITLDSISEIQQRAIDHIAGTEQLKHQDWGTLLRELSSLLRKIRDLGAHPHYPLECIIALCMMHVDEKSGKRTPLIQGQISERMPYWYDVCALYEVGADPTSGEMIRYLFTGMHASYTTGCRPPMLAATPSINNPKISDIVDTVFGRNGTPDAA